MPKIKIGDICKTEVNSIPPYKTIKKVQQIAGDYAISTLAVTSKGSSTFKKSEQVLNTKEVTSDISRLKVIQDGDDFNSIYDIIGRELFK